MKVPSEIIRFSDYSEQPFDTLPRKFTNTRKYINLEMDKNDNYVGMINKISIINDKIYVLDKRKKSLAVYSTTGKYLGAIARVRKDYINIADFDVDDKGDIFIIDGNVDNILHYSSSFNLLSVKKLPFEVDAIQTLNNNSFLLGLSSWNKEAAAGEKIIRTDNNLNVLNHIATYDEYVDDNYWITDYRFLKTKKEVFYNKPIDNDVYVFSTEGKPEKKYHFDFGTMNVPNADKKDIQNNLPKFEKYRLLAEFTVANKKIALGKIWDKKEPRFFFADRIGKVIYLENLSKPNELKHIAFYDGANLISYIYPGEYDKEAFKELPEASRAHLEKGGIVICSFELN